MFTITLHNPNYVSLQSLLMGIKYKYIILVKSQENDVIEKTSGPVAILFGQSTQGPVVQLFS